MVVVTDEKKIRKTVSGSRRIAGYVVAELEGNWAKTGKLLISGIRMWNAISRQSIRRRRSTFERLPLISPAHGHRPSLFSPNLSCLSNNYFDTFRYPPSDRRKKSLRPLFLLVLFASVHTVDPATRIETVYASCISEEVHPETNRGLYIVYFLQAKMALTPPSCVGVFNVHRNDGPNSNSGGNDGLGRV